MKSFIHNVTRLALICVLAGIIQGCGSQRVVTTWKSDDINTSNYKKLLVVAILPDKDSSLRRITENDFVDALNQDGYQAESALAQFGAHGLSNAGQENTYLMLHRRGIDAVITIALIHKTKQNFHHPGQAYIHPNSYYYKRIWNYRNIQAEDSLVDEKTSPEYFWESIVFDLSTLEAACTVRTEPFATNETVETARDMAKRILKKLTTEGIVQKRKMQKAF